MDSSNDSKELVWLSGEVKTPPFSQATRIEVGFLLRQLQEGEMLSMPVCRPMPSIGKRCYELRVNDNENSKSWRLVYRIDDDAILILDVFAKTTDKTPKKNINNCQKRLNLYNEITGAD
jgi:phage-related protein